MVDICSTYAKSHNLTFSVNIDVRKSKTKCIVFSNRAVNTANIAPILLNGSILPWVDQVTHLGHILQCDNSMNIDCNIKRGQFIGKVHSILQEFYFATPTTLMKLINIYATSFYGSNCYNMFSNSCDRLYRAWNVAVRQVYKVDRTCHRYLIQAISESLHPKVILCSRFIKFHENNLKCNKSVMRTLANICKVNITTVYGNNLHRISNECNVPVDRLTPQLVKSKMVYHDIPADQTWRLPIIREILEIKCNSFEVLGFDYNELDEMLFDACTS